MDSADDMNGNTDTASFNAYICSLLEGKSAVGAPIYFFFHIGTNNLTDESQLVNLDEIARIAKKYDLHVRVEGAADSATGTPEGNDKLSMNRSKYIGQQLLDRGIKASHIKAVSIGGVDKDMPDAANRRTKVTLYLK
jgi:outer membrane protein OmpA-like peptidoglycan-associated protein